MAVINDQDVRRIRTTSDGTRVIVLPRATPASPAPQRVTRLRPRPAAVEQTEQLPLAVGFGSTSDLQPCRLWAVPGLPADVVLLPVELDDQWSDGDWAPAIVTPARPQIVSGAPLRGRVVDDHVAPNATPRSSSSQLRESAPVSLTARGRAVLMLLAAAVGVVVVVFAWFGAASSTPATHAAQPAQVTVHDGDTLWSIAGKVAPNHDPRAVVARLLQLNHLRTPTLIPGQVLLTR